MYVHVCVLEWIAPGLRSCGSPSRGEQEEGNKVLHYHKLYVCVFHMCICSFLNALPSLFELIAQLKFRS